MALHVGVLRATLFIPTARTLKDGRQIVASVRDRVRARFEVSCHEIELTEQPSRRALLITTGGGDGRAVRAALDRVSAFIASGADYIAQSLDIDVFPWSPPEDAWMAGLVDKADDPGDDGDPA